MWFGQLPIEQCVDCVLAHSVRIGKQRVAKGTQLDTDLVKELIGAGLSHLTVARFDENDVRENTAADLLASAARGVGTRLDKAHTGRVNIHAANDGLLCYQTEAVIQANSVSEDITLSLLEPDQWVLAGRMIASAKIIPYAVAEADIRKAVERISSSDLRVIEPVPGVAVLIQTLLPTVKTTTLDKTRRVTQQRLRARSMHLTEEMRCEHTVADLSRCLLSAAALCPELILIVGASAISDRRDVLPASVEHCGGNVRRTGIPVDPGNLLMFAEYKSIPVLGLPGCARSPKHNGFDLLLDRLVCDQEITDQWLNGLCIGGLLDEVHDRPQPRVAAGDARRVAALILAAGSSRRAGDENKLLHQFDGKSMVCTVIESVQNSNVSTGLLVTGHQADKVENAVEPYGVNTCYCPGHSRGMAHSIATGISRLQSFDAVLVCLADMPHVSAEIINQIISAGDGNVIDKIVVPLYQGQRGNPVMIGRTFFDSMLRNEGDIGARDLIRQYPEKVVEVEVDSDAVLRDYDTVSSLQKLDS